MPRSEIVESCDSSVFTFLRNLQIGLFNGCINFSLTSIVGNGSFLSTASQIFVVRLVNICS